MLKALEAMIDAGHTPKLALMERCMARWVGGQAGGGDAV